MNKKLLDLMIEEHETEFKEAVRLRDNTEAEIRQAKKELIELDGLYDRQKHNADYLEQNLKNLKFFNIEEEDGI